ncbi:hypothetical protein C1929_19940 [Stenotrophomonas sp. ZAC14D1_NAIMI4_6]|nr:hypothetical protein C1929_19940 [Stenotrophomonas sp. ZAC14D1_NAIMI4_6]AWH43018.1 hypothetical protein C1927_19940 [Stenotrophomonas sp. ZAC14D1_NAIMI4_1]
MNMHSTKTVSFMSIKTQFDNLGDALINRELCRLAARRTLTYVDFSRAPQSFESSMRVDGQQNVVSLRKRGFAQLLQLMVRHRLQGDRCVFFLNPGGLGGRKKSRKSLLAASLYNVILSALYLAGVRICHVGMSFDAMDWPERIVAGWRRRLLYSFAVRDRISESYLHSIGVPVDEVVPDLSFNLYQNPAPSVALRRAVAFSFRFDGKADEKEVQQTVRRIMEALGSSNEYLFVVQVARDEPGTRRLIKALDGHQASMRLVICDSSIDDLTLLYSSCIAIYSNRLHALLLAAHAGASPYALVSRGAQPKIDGIFQDLGISERVLCVDEPTQEFGAPVPFDIESMHAPYRELQRYFDRQLSTP